MPEQKKQSKTIEIKKYQNRRYYDTTFSRHLSLEKIHQLICQGNDIKVTDAKTGTDITNKILAQILLEYEPMKLDFFSPNLLTQVIRLNDRVLKDFYETYFSKALQAFVQSRDQYQTLLRGSQALPFPQAGMGMGETRNPFTSWFGMNPFASSLAESDSKAQGLSTEMEALRKQVTELKDLLKQRSP